MRLLRALFMAGLLLWPGCSRSPQSPDGNPPPGGSLDEYTAEAGEMALVESGRLDPPPELAEAIAADLGGIRNRFGDEFPEVREIRFRPPWVTGAVIVCFTGPWLEDARHGRFPAWDELNARFEVSRIDSLVDLGNLGFVVLQSGRLLNPECMARAYVCISGVFDASPNGYVGDISTIHPRTVPLGHTYLFREGGGDCPAGCTENWYWYFRCLGGPAEFVGYWDAQEDPPPDWWAEASLNLRPPA